MSPARRAAAALLLFIAGCAQAPQPAPPPQPEGASGWTPKPGWTARRQMVAAAHPLAAEAGLAMLREGGSAADAAIAAQLVLALVEPQSSGLGGGAFLLHWDGRAVAAWDGRETAPAAADEQLFLDANGRPPPFAQATYGGRAVATPGLLRMLQAAHAEHGRLPWARLFEPAIALAEQGFPVGPRLHRLLKAEPLLKTDPRARTYFFDAAGEPHPVGHRLRNPAFAALLRAVATRGADAFYRGPAAEELVSRVRGHAVPGRLAARDLAAYAPVRREALCANWRERWRICGMPPPSSGQITLLQLLGLLDQAGAGAAAGSVPSPEWLHVYAEAARLAHADRNAWIADPAFAAPPAGRWDSLVDPGYLAKRAAAIGPRAMPDPPPGRPGGEPLAWASMAEQPEAGTSHVSVIDAQGRAVALTTSIEAAFGARVMADGGTGLPGGYLLNNEMSDFALVPRDAAGRPVANRVEPLKRPRSSMSPSFVFDAKSGELRLVIGSPGGPFIPHFVARVLLATLGGARELQPALDEPNFGLPGGPFLLERGRFPPATLQALRERGHAVAEAELTSGLHAVMRTPQGALRGAADARREGEARGD